MAEPSGNRIATRSGAPPGRFVNREAGSATRPLLVGCSQRVENCPQQIAGYRQEEFTDAAVAAMIASSSVNVAFVFEAAAARHGSSFVPLAQERYLLAMRATIGTRPAVQALLQALQNRWFASLLRDLPAYGLARVGKTASVAEAFGQMRA